MSVFVDCYYPTEVPFLTTIEISHHANVNVLRDAFHRKLEKVDVDIASLRLYHVDMSFDPEETMQQRALQWLHEHQDQNLKTWRALKKLYPVGPPDETLHILVADDEVLEMCDTLGDPNAANARKVRKACSRNLNVLSKARSPSETVKNAAGVANFLDPTKFPVSLDHLPTAMFSPILARFQQHLDNLENITPTPNRSSCAAQYIGVARQHYADEKAREGESKEHINRLIGEEGTWKNKPGNMAPDSTWWCGDFPVVLLELKNVAGVGGDAIIQGIVDFAKIISTERLTPYCGTCHFPAILIGVTGWRVEISTAVFAGRVYVSNLYTIDFPCGVNAPEKCLELARVFQAVSICKAELTTYYRGVLAGNQTTSLPPYPNPTLSPGAEGQAPPMVYRSFMNRNGQPTVSPLWEGITAMYIASLVGTEQEVVVKFTWRYNADAHRLLADAGLAPSLHFCGRVVGGAYMVVMDYVEGKAICDRPAGSPIPDSVVTRVEEALSLLHRDDIVFGDLRESNVLYVAPEGSTQEKVFLIDFDWAAKDGEGRYTPMLNTTNAHEESVAPGGTMRKIHDLWQLDRLREMRNQA